MNFRAVFVLIVAFASAPFAACSSNADRLRVPLADLGVGEPRLFPEAHLYLVRLDGPGGQDQVLALSTKSTWSGCTVLWKPDQRFETTDLSITGVFRDPCSGASQFALDGRRIFGPASTGLNMFKTSVVGDDVVVDLSAPLCGAHPAGYVSPCNQTAAAGR